jgi:hypothetical protein
MGGLWLMVAQTSIGVLQAPGTSVSDQLSHIWMNGCEAAIEGGEAG